jgi:hypothetical protein
VLALEILVNMSESEIFVSGSLLFVRDDFGVIYVVVIMRHEPKGKPSIKGSLLPVMLH